ncbi:MAG: hypothetical protein Q8O66_03955 [bacterium]|nr:hypothetical protein [bacterium]
MNTPNKKPLLNKTSFGISRNDLRTTLEKTKYSGADSLRQFDEKKERVNLEKKLFPQKFGDYVNPKEVRTIERGLRREQAKTYDPKEKARISKEMNILKNLKKM